MATSRMAPGDHAQGADLDTLWVPILPDTAQLAEQMEDVAAMVRRTVAQAVRDGIKDALTAY